MKDLTDFEKKMIMGGAADTSKDDDDHWIDPFVLIAGPGVEDDDLLPLT